MLFRKNKPTIAADPPALQPEENTITPSDSVSVSDISQEKEKEIPATGANPRLSTSSECKCEDETTGLETTGLEEAKALDKVEEELEYPTGGKLAFITFALCLSVLLMALVCAFPRSEADMKESKRRFARTIPSLLPQYLGLRTSSKPLMMSDGMEALTC